MTGQEIRPFLRIFLTIYETVLCTYHYKGFNCEHAECSLSVRLYQRIREISIEVVAGL